MRCHGASGDGRGPAFVNQRPWPRDFRKGEFKYRSTPLGTLPTAEDLEKVISRGMLRTSMPPFEKILIQGEISRLAVYVLKLAAASGKPAGTPIDIPGAKQFSSKAIAAKQIEGGRGVYERLGCVQCHGADGRGLGPAAGNPRDSDGWWSPSPDLTDPLAYGGGSDPLSIYTHLKTGLGSSAMPHYGDSVPDSSLQALAFYLASIQVPPERRELPSQKEWNKALPPSVRGEYLVRAMTCSLCHTNFREDGSYRDDLYLAGGVKIHIPGYGTIYSRNLTSDPETGLGNWSEQEIVESLIRGKTPDRQLDAFGMPWPLFHSLEEEDAKAIAAYLKSLKPIRNQIPDRKMEPFWKRLWHRLKQLVGLEYGRLEYWPGNAGSAP